MKVQLHNVPKLVGKMKILIIVLFIYGYRIGIGIILKIQIKNKQKIRLLNIYRKMYKFVKELENRLFQKSLGWQGIMNNLMIRVLLNIEIGFIVLYLNSYQGVYNNRRICEVLIFGLGVDMVGQKVQEGIGNLEILIWEILLMKDKDGIQFITLIVLYLLLKNILIRLV